MLLKPQDIFVLLKLVASGNDDWSYNRLTMDVDVIVEVGSLAGYH